MTQTYRSFFGLENEPFRADLKVEEILQTQELTGVAKRFDYVVGIGGVAVVTGEIGSGKSTALRYAAARLHPAEYKTLYVLATSGSIMELYRQIALEMGMGQPSNSKAATSPARSPRRARRRSTARLRRPTGVFRSQVSTIRSTSSALRYFGISARFQAGMVKTALARSVSVSLCSKRKRKKERNAVTIPLATRGVFNLACRSRKPEMSFGVSL